MSQTITLKRVGNTFPIGTTVSLYEGKIDNSGVPQPVGAVVSTAVVDAAENLAFANVTPEQDSYWAAAKIGGVWKLRQATVDFAGGSSGSGGGGGLSEAAVESIAAGVAAGQVAAEKVLRETADGELVSKSERSSSAMGTVYHGASGGTARPTGYAFITWIGTAEPTHAAEHDIWIKG